MISSVSSSSQFNLQDGLNVSSQPSGIQAAPRGNSAPALSSPPPYSRPVANPPGQFGPRSSEPGGNSYWSFSASDQGYEIYMRYDDRSDKLRPKMYVQTYHDGETKSYLIDIKSIDPANATRLEMYVLTVDQYGSGYGSTQPHPPELYEKIAFLSDLASPKNPLYKPDDASDFLTEQLNYVELAADLFQSPKRNEDVFKDRLFTELIELFGGFFLNDDDGETTKELGQKTEERDIYGAQNNWVM